MTTSHEQPLSRRAARERERARLRGELPTERPTEATPEPLEYATRGADGAPVLDTPRADEQPAGAALAEQERPGYRSRDYSPDGRRSTPLTPSSFAPPAAPEAPAVPASGNPAPQTSGPAEPARTGNAPGEGVSSGERTMTRRELRLLRARREAESGGTEPSTHTDAIDFLLKSGPIDLPYLLPPRPEADGPDAEASEKDAAGIESAAADTSEADAPATDARGADTDAAEADAAGTDAGDADAIDVHGSDEPNDEPSTTDEADVPTGDEPPALVEPAPLAPAFIEPPAADAAPAQASSDAAWAALLGRAQAQAEAGRPLDTPLDAIVPEAQPTVEAAEVAGDAPANGTGGDAPRPAEHWSQQAADDSRAAFEGGSTGSFAPSALVMPNAPHTGEFSYSLSTGEILVTGSIDLPRSLGSTGAHSDRIDDSSIDHVLDPRDQELTSTDSAPVRAVRAVSSHTSTRGMIATPPKKARSTKYLTALVIATSVMAVVAVTLLIVAAVTGNL